jgi:hypothetical protein
VCMEVENTSLNLGVLELTPILIETNAQISQFLNIKFPICFKISQFSIILFRCPLVYRNICVFCSIVIFVIFFLNVCVE